MHPRNCWARASTAWFLNASAGAIQATATTILASRVRIDGRGEGYMVCEKMGRNALADATIAKPLSADSLLQRIDNLSAARS